MSGYRDETETLRAELDRVRAELATIKSEPREVEAISYTYEDGSPREWAIVALVVLSLGVVACMNSATSNHPIPLRIFFAIGALCQIGWLLHVAWRLLPRVKVKR